MIKKIYWTLSKPSSYLNMMKWEKENLIECLWLFPIKDDLLDSRNGYKKMKNNNNFSVKYILNSGHVPMHENPEHLSKMIKKWLNN